MNEGQKDSFEKKETNQDVENENQILPKEEESNTIVDEESVLSSEEEVFSKENSIMTDENIDLLKREDSNIISGDISNYEEEKDLKEELSVQEEGSQEIKGNSVLQAPIVEEAPEASLSQKEIVDNEATFVIEKPVVKKESVSSDDGETPISKEEEENFSSVEQALASEPFEKELSSVKPDEGAISKTPKKGKKKLLPILFGVLALIIVIVAIWYFVFNNSKNIFLGAINKEYTTIMGSITVDTPYEKAKKSSIVTTGDLKITVDDLEESLVGKDTVTLFDEINKLDIHYLYGLDYKNKKSAFQTNITYNKKDMLHLNAYGEGKNMYLELKDLFSKYISIPYEGLDSLFENPNASLEDMKIVTKALKDSFLKSLDSKDFIKTQETVSIDNKKQKLKKISYTLNKENMTKIVTSMIEDLKKNKNFVSIVAKYSNKKEEDVKSSLDSVIKEYENNKVNMENVNFTLSIYFKGLTNTAVQYEIKDESGDTIVYQKNHKEKIVTFLQNKEEFMKFVVKEESDKKVVTTISIPSLDLEGVIERNIEDTSSIYNLLFKDSKETFKIDGKYVMNKKENGNTIDGNADFTLKMEAQNQVLGTIKVTSTATSTIGKTVEVPNNFTNSVDIEKMTDEESTEILTNMMQNETFMQFINNIMNMTNMGNNAYNE